MKLDDTFEALSTYYEFEELKPIGEQGDHITLELAEKLVQMDLLEDGAKILNRYVKKIAEVEEKVLIMTRVAILQYLNNQTENAAKGFKRK